MFSGEIEGCGEASSPKNEPDPDLCHVFDRASQLASSSQLDQRLAQLGSQSTPIGPDRVGWRDLPWSI
jgi:hypothetical protein